MSARSQRIVPRRFMIWCCLFVCFVSGSLVSSAISQELRLGSPIGEGVRNRPNGNLFVGRLETMRHNDNGKTRMALLNEQNQVVAFVAPTGRYDMQQYLGKEIGVSAKSFSQSDAGVPFVIVDSLTPMSPDDVGTPARVDDWTRQPQDNGEVRQAAYETPTRSPRISSGSPRIPPRSPGGVEPACHTGSCGSMVADGVVVSDTAVEVVSKYGDAIVDGCTDCLPGDPCSSCSSGAAIPYHGIHCQIPNCSHCQSARRTATICQPVQPACGPPGWLWLRGEYLLWWAKGMNTPPMVTTDIVTAGANQAGTLGPDSTATVIYGDEEVLLNGQSGFRVSFGGFFGPQRKFGYVGDFYSVSTDDDEFFANEISNPILARPYIDLNPDQDRFRALTAAFPGRHAGEIRINASSDFSSAGGRARWNFCCKQRCDSCGGGGGGCQRCGYAPFCKIDFTAGYRHYNLEELITVDQDFRLLDGTNSRFEIDDRFETTNSFHGAELGFQWEAGWNRWTFELLSMMAIGNNQQTVSIDGNTLFEPGQGTTTEVTDTGFQAFDSEATRDTFAMIPSMNVNLGFYLTPRFRFIVGYSILYWGGVLRPGEHIPTEFDSGALPPPEDNATRPEIAFDETDYWIQGLNLGLDYRW